VPPDLVSVSQAGIAGHGKVRALLIDDLRAMAEAAAAAGNAIGVESAYRSYADQQATFASWVAQLGYAGALRVSARPGHSEHQLGLAIDFRSDPGGSPFTGSWGQTPAGKWMRLHAWNTASSGATHRMARRLAATRASVALPLRRPGSRCGDPRLRADDA
jgi:D-alanyl-D-alanine carboxypeptidase